MMIKSVRHIHVGLDIHLIIRVCLLHFLTKCLQTLFDVNIKTHDDVTAHGLFFRIHIEAVHLKRPG